jgi:hypothetical protein
VVVTIRIPALPPGLLSNLVGLLGLVAIIVAIGALTSWPWALMSAGLFAVTLSALAGARQAASSAPVRSLKSAGKAA